MPRGDASPTLSGMVGMPVELEKRDQMGVEEELKCLALERDAASAVGVKVPESRMPRA